MKDAHDIDTKKRRALISAIIALVVVVNLVEKKCNSYKFIA